MSKGLKPDHEGLGMMQCKNTNSFALPESRVRPEKWSIGTDPALQDMRPAVAHRFPNLACTGEDEVGRQQGPFIVL